MSVDGTVFPTKIVKESLTRDLCALASVGGFTPININKDKEYQYGDILFVVGYPSRYPLHISKGTIVGGISNYYASPPVKSGVCLPGGMYVKLTNNKTKKEETFCSYEAVDTVTTVHVRGGSSGSPLIDDQGDAVGIVWGRDEGSWALAVSAKDIINFIEGL